MRNASGFEGGWIELFILIRGDCISFVQSYLVFEISACAESAQKIVCFRKFTEQTEQMLFASVSSFGLFHKSSRVLFLANILIMRVSGIIVSSNQLTLKCTTPHQWS